MLILTASDIRRALPMRAAIDSQKRAYASLVTGEAHLPVRTSVPVPDQNAVTLFMPSRVGPELGAKIVSVFPNNVASGLPIIHGVVVMVDTATGQPTALMDATYLTALRTAAGAGAATELLARPESRVAAIIGSGTLARTHLLAMCEARPIERIVIYSRDAQKVAKFIAEMQPLVGAALVAAHSSAEAIREADVICAVTTSKTPVLNGHDLKPGAHLNGLGSFTLEMQEIDAETIRRAGRAFVDSLPAIVAESGELVAALSAGLIKESDLIEIGNVAAGRHPGRVSADEITFFKSVGVAVQDVSAGGEVLRRAKAMGLGVEIAL